MQKLEARDKILILEAFGLQVNSLRGEQNRQIAHGEKQFWIWLSSDEWLVFLLGFSVVVFLGLFLNMGQNDMEEYVLAYMSTVCISSD